MKDVVIIGGGLLGAATAYQLSKLDSNLKITLLERYDTAAQASARAACLLTRLRTKPDVAAMVEETYSSIERVESLLGESLNLQRCGSITIASSDGAVASLESLAEIAQKSSINYEWLTREQVKQQLPWIDTTLVERALLTTDDAFIDSALWCNAMIKASQIQGVEVRTGCEVSEIMVDSGRVKGVKLTDGSIIEASAVINAAGAWSNLLMEPLPFRLAHTPVRSHFWITEVDEQQFPAAAPFSVIGDARAFTRPDVGAMIVGIREPECLAYDPKELPTKLENLVIDEHGSWQTLSQCADNLLPYFPGLLDTGIAHYVAGPSCYVPDSNFLIGAVPYVEGLYAIAGCCGAGVAAGAGMGRLMAEIVLGRDTFVNPEPFRVDRFGSVDPFSQEFRQLCADARANKKGG